jgi:hypothetical protein
VAAPEGGNYDFDFDGYFVASQVGIVDWDGSMLAHERTYVADYTTLSDSTVATFSLTTWGDYVMSATVETFFLNGLSRSTQLDIDKRDCTWTTVATDPGNKSTMTMVSTLVSTDKFEYTQTSDDDAGTGWVFDATGQFTSDWTNSYSFVTDDPNSEGNPDREGSCVSLGTGDSECDMVLRFEADRSQDHHNIWAANGDWVGTWDEHNPAATADPEQWGERRGEYLGGGTSWWYRYGGEGTLVYCESEWDVTGAGTWWCDDGGSGTL